MSAIYVVEAGWWKDDGMVMWFTLHSTIEGAKKEAEIDAALYANLDDTPIEWWKEDHSGREYVHGKLEVADMGDTLGYNIYAIEVKE